MFWAVLSGQAPRHTQNTSDFTDAPYLCWHQSQISRMSRKVLKHFSTLLFPEVGQDPKQKEQLSMGFHLKSWPGYRWVVGYGGNQNENPKIISRVFKSIWRNYSLVIHKFYGQKGPVIISSDFLQDRQLSFTLHQALQLWLLWRMSMRLSSKPSGTEIIHLHVAVCSVTQWFLYSRWG